MDRRLFISDDAKVVRVLTGSHLTHWMVHRDVEAVLIHGVSSHGLVGPPTFTFGLFLLTTFNFVLDVAKVSLELLDHLLSVPQLLQCIVCEVH